MDPKWNDSYQPNVQQKDVEIKSSVSPKSVKLPGEPWRARFRKSVTNIELNLGWDHVLMSQ